MKFIKISYLLLAILFLGCSEQPIAQPNLKKQEIQPVEVPMKDGLARAYFAGGCFWCVEAICESVYGVEESISGYSGGHTENPTYEMTNTGRTGHAEAVEVIYNPMQINFETLVDMYLGSIDPTQVNGQGPDRGSQYRSIIFYQNEEQKQIAIQKVEELFLVYDKAIAVEIMPFEKFWKAEAYHQNYKKNNPNNPYIRNVSDKRLREFKEKFPHLLKENN